MNPIVLTDPLEVAQAILAESMRQPARLSRYCPACYGQGGTVDWPAGCHQPDPQTEIVCERCEGTGLREDNRR